MNARLVQVLTRYAGYFLAWLLAKLGMPHDDGTLEGILGPIGTGLGVLVTIVLDHYLHAVQTKADEKKMPLG